jgi:hypothetical protein
LKADGTFHELISDVEWVTGGGKKTGPMLRRRIQQPGDVRTRILLTILKETLYRETCSRPLDVTGGVTVEGA